MKTQVNKKNQKKKSHKKLWIILGIVAALVIVLVVLAVRGLQNMASQLSAVMEQTAEAETGEIAVTTEGIGVVETAEEETVYADYNVTLRKLYKKNGEQVAAGEAIAEYDGILLDETITALEEQLAQLDSQLGNMTRSGSTRVKAPVTGRVKEIYGETGASVVTVQNQQPGLALISADGKLKVEFSPEAAVEEGQKVTVIYGEESVQGRIQEASKDQAVAVFEDSDRYELQKEVAVQSEDGVHLGTGVTACGHSVYVTAESGDIQSISVSKNERVSAGSTLFRLENVSYSQEYVTALERRDQLAKKVQEAKEYKKGFVVTAKKDGIVHELSLREGDMLPAGTALCKLLDTERYQVVLDIDELDIQGIAQGQQVEVTIDAIENMVYEGTVAGVSMVGENNGNVGTYQVSVDLEAKDMLLPGMSANGKITKDYKKDALLVPVDTLQTIDGKKSVTVVGPDGSHESREVTLGLVNNDYAEVLSGVQEGEKLQVIVKLSDLYSQMGISLDQSEIE